MNYLSLSIKQPITVAVGVILSLLAGLLALQRLPVQMAPHVESVVIAVTTFWENASPEEIESDVIEQQEQRLGNLSGLRSMTSISQSGSGQIRLEFHTGTDIKKALAEVDLKLSEVPSYPSGVDKPQIEDVDPESIDYIAWIGLSSTDPAFDPTTLYDFMEKRLKPRFERIPGIAEVGIVGAREREVHLIVDPEALAQRRMTWQQFVDAIQIDNQDWSGGRVAEGKHDVRVRAVGRFDDVDQVGNLVLRQDDGGPVLLREVAEIRSDYKEPTNWVRSRGHRMPFLNYQLEQGGNVLDAMREIKLVVDEFAAPGGLLEREARRLGIDGTLELVQTYDATSYVNDALDLVQGNVVLGSILAVLTLLLFLRSLHAIGIIAVAIPISVISSIAILALLGRTLNIISLAGIAFATGMVVDNAIVVIENIFSHLEKGKRVARAAYDGTREVAGAVVASTLTTLVVFLPILLIEEAAGQLFRDIALAIMASVGMSMVAALTVIPSGAALLLRPRRAAPTDPTAAPRRGRIARIGAGVRWLFALPEHARSLVLLLTRGWLRRAAVIAVLGLGTLIGIAWLVPPLDYVPQGNRNIVFGLMTPPPGYNFDQLEALGKRIEERIRPAWQAVGDRFGVEARARDGAIGPDARQPIPLGRGQAGEVMPPGLEHYFMVSFDGRLFHGGIAHDKTRAIDLVPLFDHAVAGGAAPDVFSFAFQFPLFRIGGTTGSAIKVHFAGDDLAGVTQAAGAAMFALMQQYGPYSIRPEPSNFLLPTPELRVTPHDDRLKDLGMTRRDVGLAVQASGDGILLPRQFEAGGELKDLKIISNGARAETALLSIAGAPVATPGGHVVDVQSLAHIEHVAVTDQIKHVDRQRAVTIEFTPPVGVPLGAAVDQLDDLFTGLRGQGAMPASVNVTMSGSAGHLAEIREALLGDGTLLGTLQSSLFLALLVVYLLMVVLFQSWTYPLVILVSVPLATLGGFAALALVHAWSTADRYMPVQNLDVLTILGFVILAGVVVNNAILIVHQALNLLRDGATDPREAIAESVRSRVRPILMSTLTSVGGMLPLVLMPGSGSELYRGLGAVVLGGLVVSTLFTLVLVPVLLDIMFRFRRPAFDKEELS